MTLCFMDTTNAHHYPAKVLLFGEHTILRGSRALARPFPQRRGHWARNGHPGQQQQLSAFAGYLAAELSDWLDVDAFRADLAEGIYFASDIPSGYGLGSSGALCAGVWERYALPMAMDFDPARLKGLLGRMESFFHGRSSGADPLISFLRQSLLLLPSGEVEIITPPTVPVPYHLFLLDTRHPRTTGPLVDYFTQRFDGEETFRRQVQEEWIAPTEQAIDAYLTGDGDGLWTAVDRISRFQLAQLPPMVPGYIQESWQQGLSGDHYRLKICGAGGGGFCLGITTDWAATQQQLAMWPLQRL
jgi:mevalonate kinase